MRVLVGFLAFAVCMHAVSAELKNTNVARHVDLTASGIVREKISVIFSDSAQSVSTYDIAIPWKLASNLSSLSVVERRDRKVESGVPLQVGELAKHTTEFKLYRVQLPSALPAGEKSSLDISITYIQAVKPYPHVVGQTDPQYLLYEENAYLNTIYATEKQKTTVRLPTSTLVSDIEAPKPHSRSGTTITFGPYQDIDKNSKSLLSVHYEDNGAILVAKTLHRQLEISHLGSNLAVMESYDLHHRGALLRGSAFSRIDHQFSTFRHGQTNIVKDIKVLLPGNISNVFYRDDIGNVSTSNLRNGKFSSLLHIRPRYPLFGGWKYAWHHTYDVPLGDFLKTDASGQNFQFSIPFVGSIKNISIEEAHLSVALPDGASNVKVFAPFKPDQEFIETYYTNLDTLGRPRVNIVKKNVADEHAGFIRITYYYPNHLLYRKFFVVSSIIFGFLLMGMVIARLDLSLVKPTELVLLERKQKEAQRVLRLVEKLDATFKTFVADFDSFKSTKDFDKLKKDSKASQVTLGEIMQQLQYSYKRSQIFDNDFADLVESLHGEYKKKIETSQKLQEAVTEFLRDARDGVDEKRTIAVQGVIAEAEATLNLAKFNIPKFLQSIKSDAKL
ncbi:proteasome regulatory particle base subunit [Phlyctochytrium planicorne]|nr:proteasome regulatory particle base subunit [Phlyctochytrium planicorne]